MKIKLIGELIEQEDGSAIAQLDMDEEGKMYLIQRGFEALVLEGLSELKTDIEITKE